ncbi:hypothetical protein Tco_0340424, partial [Tanacetum coccineum]
ATAMKIALQARNKMCFLDGTCTKASYITNVVLSNQWERCNDVVLSWLLSSISDDLYLSQVYSENATEMGLDDVYLPIRSSLLTHTELPDVKDAFVIVCREESHRGLGSELNITVGYPNGTTAKIRKVGNLKLTSNIVLFDVLVIPEYRDLKRENVLRTGIWHNKLGHPSDQVLSVLKNILSIGKPTHSMPWGPYKVTTRDGFRLPSSVLNGKSPFFKFYGREPSYLRSFGCLCFSKVLNENDKFSQRSEKCVLIGFSSVKKAYKLSSLENRRIFYSRDVTFYETIFPYKMSLEKDKCLVKDSYELIMFSDNDDLTSHKTFFDNSQTDSQASSPNDDGGMPTGSNIEFESQSDDTVKEQSSDDDQGSVQIGEDDLSEGNFVLKIMMFPLICLTLGRVILLEVIMEYLVKIRKKARILELKRKHLKITDSGIQYAVSIKEDTTYLCLHFTKDHKGTRPNTPYPEKTNTPYSSYGNKIFWKISNVVPTLRKPSQSGVSTIFQIL